MVVTGTNGGAYCEGFGAIVLSGLADTVTVEYSITHYRDGNTPVTDRMTETYSPDASGQVRLNDLGKLAQCYFPDVPIALYDTSTAFRQYAFQVDIDMAVSNAAGASLGAFSQRFFYSNCRTTMEDAYKYRGFLTRHRRTKVLPEQDVRLGFFGRGQSLYVGVSYVQGSARLWKEVKLQSVNDNGLLTVYNLNVPTIAKAAQTTAEGITYYIVYLKADGEVIDAVQFDVDTRFFPVKNHFVYYNCFGVPETLYFTGRDNRSTELDATYARIGHEYHKIKADYNIYHEVNTGYINEALRDCVEDLVNSRKVWLYDERGLGDLITVTGVDFPESKPRTEPVNVRLTYRVANECQRRCDRDPTLDYRIFDHTFGIEFE